MGLYLEPREDKREWMESNGMRASVSSFEAIPSDQVFVCMIDNGAFIALAVAYSEREFDYFLTTKDDRPKEWYLVDKNIAKSVTDPEIWDGYMKDES